MDGSGFLDSLGRGVVNSGVGGGGVGGVGGGVGGGGGGGVVGYASACYQEQSRMKPGDYPPSWRY